MGTTAVGGQVWFEIYIDDLAQAQTFYEQVFGWSLRPFTGYDPENYLLIAPGDGGETIGGLVVRGTQGVAGDGKRPGGVSTVPYFKVTDLGRVLAVAVELGAELIVPARKISSVDGYFAMIRDSSGNEIGIWAQDAETTDAASHTTTAPD
jgi:predicted enzyme related to lactoylglutathione lyase